MSNSTVSELAALPGLTSAKRAVMGLATGESNVHAVLFYGAPGAGKGAIAKALTRAWLCRNPGPEGACGECQACTSFERGRAADVLVIAPVGPSRLIRIDAMMTVPEDKGEYPTKALQFVRTPPLTARNKVVIFEEAERMNSRAANALLKTLEEPHGFTRMILLTAEVGSLLPTILSRTLAVACELPAEIQADGWAVTLSGGAPWKAADLMEHATVYKPIATFAQSLPKRSKAEALAASEEFSNLCDGIEDARKLNARAANAEGVELLAVAYSKEPDHNPEALQAMVETHRRILGNGNAGANFDALFTSILN